jgi:hypothetical protein
LIFKKKVHKFNKGKQKARQPGPPAGGSATAGTGKRYGQLGLFFTNIHKSYL